MVRYRRTVWRAAVLWLCIVCGGACAGASGLVLLQLRFVHYMRDEVQQLGRFERWMGKVLFNWRPLDEKLALALSELPEESLRRAELAAKVLVAAGLAMAVVGPSLLRWRWRH